MRFLFWAENELAFYFQGMQGKGELPKDRLVRSGVRVGAQDKADVEEKGIAGVLFSGMYGGGKDVSKRVWREEEGRCVSHTQGHGRTFSFSMHSGKPTTCKSEAVTAMVRP